jgi:hypothetical protein
VTPSDDDPRARIRRLLLSGDNILKNRDDDARIARARTRYEEARDLAVAAGADDLARLAGIRLADLTGGAGGA